MYDNTTIAAISTPFGTGGIAVIRVSGDDALTICDKIFKNPSAKTLVDCESHKALYGYIMEDGTEIDEVLCTVFKAPKSFTGENTVEISCHGGILITKRILECVIKAGAHMASPGEFTKRAFLNGKLDLSQANAVIDLINANSKAASSLALNQLRGGLSDKINSLRANITDMIAEIDAASDFPEEDLDTVSVPELRGRIEKIYEEVNKLISGADRGRLIRDGINTVIVGKPNVGKSSLLNALSLTDRAIVTDIAGTTRDVVEESVNIGNITLNIFDTAGIRETDDVIETIGIEKTKEYVKNAELVLFVLDAQCGIDKEDIEIADLLKDKKTIAVINKTDLAQGLDIKDLNIEANSVSICAKDGNGIEELSLEIERLFSLGEISRSDEPIVTNVSHIESLTVASGYLEGALNAANGDYPEDFISIDLRNAAESLGEITGRAVSDEVVHKIFSKFCLGK